MPTKKKSAPKKPQRNTWKIVAIIVLTLNALIIIAGVATYIWTSNNPADRFYVTANAYADLCKPEILDEVVSRSIPSDTTTPEQMRAWIGYNCFEFDDEKDGVSAYNKGLSKYLTARGLDPIK